MCFLNTCGQKSNRGQPMGATRLTYLFMPVSIVLAFLYAPPAEGLGESSRILYFHVPMAWISVLAFLVAGLGSILFLVYGEKRFALMEQKFHNSAVIGLVCTLLTTVSGSLWAKLAWGSYWNWDPRETSIAVLLLIYGAYFSLRAALAGNSAGGRIGAVYLVFSMALTPFLVFIVPRLYPSLHPDPILNPTMKVELDHDMRITLLFSVFSFTLLYFHLFSLMNRVSRLDRILEEAYEE
jgi:heme exporter protein C